MPDWGAALLAAFDWMADAEGVPSYAFSCKPDELVRVLGIGWHSFCGPRRRAPLWKRKAKQQALRMGIGKYGKDGKISLVKGRASRIIGAGIAFDYIALPLYALSLGKRRSWEYRSAMDALLASDSFESLRSAGEEKRRYLLDITVAGYIQWVHTRMPDTKGLAVCQNLVSALLHRNLRLNAAQLGMATASLESWSKECGEQLSWGF